MTEMDIELPYLSKERSRHGRVSYYVRWKGKRVRINDRPGNLTFLTSYQDALRIAQGVVPIMPKLDEPAPMVHAAQSLGWLVDRYLKESPEYQTLHRTGRKRRERILLELAGSHGKRGMVMATEAISAGVAKRAATPGAANEWLKTVKVLYGWAERTGIVTRNPASAVRKIKVATNGFHIWSLDEIKTFVDKHPFGSRAYLALMLLLFTGLRREDASTVGRQHFRGSVFHFRPGKTARETGAEVATEVVWPLAEAIAACPPPLGSTHMAILLSSLDAPFASGASFGNWFGDRCHEAGLPHCTAHGLRKAGATIAGEAGASELMLDAMYGWNAWKGGSSGNQSRTYTRGADNIRLATAGFTLIADVLAGAKIAVKGQSRNRIVAPRRPGARGATKTASK